MGGLRSVLECAASAGAGALMAPWVWGLKGGNLCFPHRKRANLRELATQDHPLRSREQRGGTAPVHPTSCHSSSGCDPQGQSAGPKGECLELQASARYLCGP